MQRLRHRRRAPQRQLEVLPADTPAPDAAPTWDALPDRTRRVLTGLMARLLLAHADGAAPAPGGDADER